MMILPVALRWRRSWAAIAAVAVLSASLNWPVLANSPVNDFAAVCPPALVVNGGL